MPGTDPAETVGAGAAPPLAGRPSGGGRARDWAVKCRARAAPPGRNRPQADPRPAPCSDRGNGHGRRAAAAAAGASDSDQEIQVPGSRRARAGYK